jgi:hypothetical protein
MRIITSSPPTAAIVILQGCSRIPLNQFMLRPSRGWLRFSL